MQALRNPEVLLFDLPTELLEYLLEEPIPTTLIVCSTRDVFLQELLASVQTVPSTSTPTPGGDSADEERQESVLHPFLLPTIHLLATSKNIRLVFCPTLQHLRAFLSVFPAHEHLQTSPAPTAGNCRPYLAILNPVALHHDTTEFSAQGLSRTFALTVDVAARERLNLILCEAQSVGQQHNMVCGPGLWEVEVPLLNGTVRLGGEDRDWAGRMIKVKRVAQRWFNFKMNEEEEPPLDAMDI